MVERCSENLKPLPAFSFLGFVGKGEILMSDQDLAPNISLRPYLPKDLKVKDRTILPPDRVMFTYYVFDPSVTVPPKPGFPAGIREVLGNYNDWQRDWYLQRVWEEPQVTTTKDFEGIKRMQITDFYDGIPDKAFVNNPLLDG